MIGTLGDAVFQASTDKVYTFQGLGRSAPGRYQQHDVVGQKPVLEFIGPGLEQISFDMRFDVGLGINPIAEIDKLRAARDAATIMPLTIGGSFLGDWIIEDVKDSWDRVDNRGTLLVASVSVSLKEALA